MNSMNAAQLFGVLVCRIRMRKRLSVEELAERSGLTTQRVRAMEAARGEPTLRELIKISKAARTKPSHIMRFFDARARKAKRGRSRS
jgi:transcriptional regulator with XRE-family HTH domain